MHHYSIIFLNPVWGSRGHERKIKSILQEEVIYKIIYCTHISECGANSPSSPRVQNRKQAGQVGPRDLSVVLNLKETTLRNHTCFLTAITPHREETCFPSPRVYTNHQNSMSFFTVLNSDSIHNQSKLQKFNHGL